MIKKNLKLIFILALNCLNLESKACKGSDPTVFLNDYSTFSLAPEGLIERLEDPNIRSELNRQRSLYERTIKNLAPSGVVTMDLTWISLVTAADKNRKIM